MKQLFLNFINLCKVDPQSTHPKSGPILVWGFIASLIVLIGILLIQNQFLTKSSTIIMVFLLVGIPIILALGFRFYLTTHMLLAKKDLINSRLSQKKINYLESIIQDSSDIIFTIDKEYFIVKFNKGAEYHFGYSQEEIVGKPISFLFVNDEKIHMVLGETQKTGKSANAEISIRTKYKKVKQLNLGISEMNYENEQSNLNGFVITAKEITEKKRLENELRKKNEELSKLAITDSLTKLYNVRHFYTQIKRELKRHYRRPNRKLSLILIDIDRFKSLNDTEGHQMGDHVLFSLAEVIRVCIRADIDSAYRYGGDEFVIILPDTDKMQADVVATRIQNQFGAFKFGMTSLSIGITEAEPKDNEETIVKRADDALYSSKRSGKNCITFT